MCIWVNLSKIDSIRDNKSDDSYNDNEILINHSGSIITRSTTILDNRDQKLVMSSKELHKVICSVQTLMRDIIKL